LVDVFGGERGVNRFVARLITVEAVAAARLNARMLIEFNRQPMSHEVYLMKVAQARRMTPGERLDEAIKLTEAAFQKQRERVRRENPTVDEYEITRLCKAEMDEYRRVKEEGIYVDVPRSV
jgi:hypothetical protein